MQDPELEHAQDSAGRGSRSDESASACGSHLETPRPTPWKVVAIEDPAEFSTAKYVHMHVHDHSESEEVDTCTVLLTRSPDPIGNT